MSPKLVPKEITTSFFEKLNMPLPNSCNLNLYSDGLQSVGWHDDDEAWAVALSFADECDEQTKRRLQPVMAESSREPALSSFDWRVHYVLSSDTCASYKTPFLRLSLFDEKRRRQVWCMLALIPERDALPEGLTNLDDAIIDSGKVELLLSNLPSADEEAALRRATETSLLGPNQVWDAAEEFMIRLTSIPEYRLRPSEKLKECDLGEPRP